MEARGRHPEDAAIAVLRERSWLLLELADFVVQAGKPEYAATQVLLAWLRDQFALREDALSKLAGQA